jgi:ankyrin repeat protein
LHSIGAPLAVTEPDPYTVLHGVASGKVDNTVLRLLQWCLENGADPNSRDAYGTTPLQFACVKGNVAVVKVLLQAGADINSTDDGGSCPLLRASAVGCLDIMEVLLASPGLQRNMLEEARMTAIDAGKAAAYELITESDAFKGHLLQANIREQQLDELRNIRTAADVKCLDAVIKHAVHLPLVVAQTELGTQRNLLHYAVAENRPVSIICRLLKLGIDPTARDSNGHTPADLARAQGNNAMLPQLLDRAAQDYRAQQANS